eukprot:980395-Pyramimonas_sp.AAC.2
MAAQSPYRPESVHVDDVGGHLLEDPLEQNRQLVVEAIHLNAQAEPLVEHGRVQAGHVRQVARLVEGVLHQLQRQEETKVALSCKCVWEGGRVRSRWAREYLRTLSTWTTAVVTAQNTFARGVEKRSSSLCHTCKPTVAITLQAPSGYTLQAPSGYTV